MKAVYTRPGTNILGDNNPSENIEDMLYGQDYDEDNFM